MSEPIPIPKSRFDPRPEQGHLSPNAAPPLGDGTLLSEAGSSPPSGLRTPMAFISSSQGSPALTPFGSTRSGYFSSNSSSYQEDWDFFPPLNRMTVFDLLDNLALPQRLEKLQQTLSAQTERVRRQQEKLKNSGANAKDRVVEEWRRRVPPPDEQLLRYRRKMRDSVDRLGRRWNDAKAVTTREKASFIAGVLNIFVSGYLIGAHPEYMHIWYSVQLCYFMPIRAYTYHRKGYHYFLADLCYFVNLLAVLSIWLFPRSKRLFMSTYCLAYGNNAVAIAMWRNSMVFHSLDKVTSLFIHIMPPVVLHCIVHLLSDELLQSRFPAVYEIKSNLSLDAAHYHLGWMVLWASIPYAVWQLSYHVLITVRRREKIAAGRPTSFTWLRRSYARSWIGKFVLALPDSLQEPAFMLIQYAYAATTMLPCPIWFRYGWPSAIFLLVVFAWSVWNGACYYLDVFGKRFQVELEQLKQEVAKWHNSPDLPSSGEMAGRILAEPLSPPPARFASPHIDQSRLAAEGESKRSSSIDQIPLLDGGLTDASGADFSSSDVARRKPLVDL